MADRDPRGRELDPTGRPIGPAAGNGRDDRSLPELFRELTGEVSTLFKQEVALARAEISEKVSQAGKGVMNAVIGGTVAFLGVQVLLASVVLLLALVMPAWLAALIVGGIIAVVGLVMLNSARKELKPSNLKPTQTQQSLREDVQMMKERIQ